MKIKVLGSGCARCRSLEQVTSKAVEDMGLDAEIEKVEDMRLIMGYGVMRTPALIINDKIILSGQVPDLGEMKEILNNNL